MNPTQIARRADALYSDGSTGITRRVLCDMVARRESNIEDLRTLCADLWEFATTTCLRCAGGPSYVDEYMTKGLPLLRRLDGAGVRTRDA